MKEITDIRIGDFVRYKVKNEIGLVGQIILNRDTVDFRCWFHKGGTRALINEGLVERLSLAEAIGETFSNDYVKQSLLERRMRLLEGGDVRDLIEMNVGEVLEVEDRHGY